MLPSQRKRDYLRDLLPELKLETAYHLPYQELIIFCPFLPGGIKGVDEKFCQSESFWKEYARRHILSRMGIKRGSLDWFSTVRNHFVHQLEILLDRFPDEKWCWSSIFPNSSLSSRYIEDRISDNGNKAPFDKIPIDWNLISQNPNITLEFLERHIREKWDWFNLSLNPNLTIDFVRSHINKKWNWYNLSSNKSFNMNGIEATLGNTLNSRGENPSNEFKWNFEGISANPNITLEFLTKYIDKEWNYTMLSMNPGININFVKTYKDEPWDFGYLSRNKAINLEDIVNNPDLKWDYQGLSGNPKLTIDFIKSSLGGNSGPSGERNQNWSWQSISANKGISIRDVEDNPNLPWDYEFLSRNPNITIGFVLKIVYENIRRAPKPPEKDFNWETLSRNPGISVEEMLKYNLYWEWSVVSLNPTLTAEIVISTYGKIPWSFRYLSDNRFD